MDYLGSEVVEPMVAKDNCPPWFIARTHSQTSSTSDRLYHCVKNVTPGLRNQIGIRQEDWRMVSEYLGDKEASNEFAQSDGGDKELQVQMNVSLMLSDDAMFEAFKQEFNDGKLDEMTTRLYVKALGGKHTGVIEAVKSLLESWIEQDSECRPYFFLTEKELLEEAKSRIERFKKDKRNRAQLIQVLVDHDRENGGTGGTLGMRPIDRLRLNLIKRVLQSSFLPKLYGKGKEYCKRGHDLEPVYARALRKDSEEGLTDVVFEETCNLGMCRKLTRTTE